MLRCTSVLMLSSIAFSLKSSFRFVRGHASMSVSAQTKVHDGTNVIQKLKEILVTKGVDAFIIPTDDPHLSEYTAPYYGRREYISGFTGSAGSALITKEKSLLFTDGRYHNQASLELDASSWTLMKSGLKDVPTIPEYLSETLPSGSVVGIDPYLHSAAEYAKLNDALSIKGIKLKPLEHNPVDDIWTVPDRPAPPNGKLRVHPIEYAGKSVQNKLSELRTQLQLKHTYGIVSAALDEIAWVYNIRGEDVPCNPVSVAYALVTLDNAYLFIDSNKVPSEVQKHLSESGVTLSPYQDTIPMITQLTQKEGRKIWIDIKKVNEAIHSATTIETRYVADSPIVLMKATKNDMEIQGMKAAHLRDGAAMAEFFCWLEKEIARRCNTNSSDNSKDGTCTSSRSNCSSSTVQGVTEVEIDEVSTAFRKSYEKFVDLSFPTIAGVGSNGAIIHYRAVKETCKTLTNNDLILLDSGAQYLDGTTDVTRTFHTGTPTDYQKEMFTRVLKGNIAIDQRVFPVGTPGCLIDSYAREHLWAIGKDFLHGVGHGVGAALNVHEGPHSISRALIAQPLIPGMIVSNEPGYYEDGNFGIRIENLLLVVKKEELGEYKGRTFLGFERLTHIPIQKKMIQIDLLTPKEIQWINEYHENIRKKIIPLIKSEEAKEWLIKNTTPL